MRRNETVGKNNAGLLAKRYPGFIVVGLPAYRYAHAGCARSSSWLNEVFPRSRQIPACGRCSATPDAGRYGCVPSRIKEMAPKTGPFLLHFVMMAAMMMVMNDHYALRMRAVPAAFAAITVT